MSSKFVFITPVYNCEKTIHKTLNSLISQSYENWHAYVIDDMSTDNTNSTLCEFIEKRGLEDKITVITRDEKFGEVRNTIELVNECDDEEIIVRVDGGDWLTDNDTLWFLDKIYSEHDPAAVWTAHRWEYTTKNISAPLKNSMSPYRQDWVTSHLKTFRVRDAKGINEKNFRDDDNNWIMIACDQAVFLPILYRAMFNGRPLIFFPFCCYHYSINLKDPELFKSDRSLQQKQSAEFIRRRGYIE